MYQARTLPPSYIPRAWFLELGSLLAYLRLALKFAVLSRAGVMNMSHSTQILR